MAGVMHDFGGAEMIPWGVYTLLQSTHPLQSVYTPCNDSLKGLHPSGNHHSRSKLVFNPCDHSLRGVDPSWNHRIPSILVYTPCDDYLRGVNP